MQVPFHSILCLQRKTPLRERRVQQDVLPVFPRQENIHPIGYARPVRIARPSLFRHCPVLWDIKVHTTFSSPVPRQLEVEVIVRSGMKLYFFISKIELGGILCYLSENFLHDFCL